MDYMELQFPDDARDESVRRGRNISDTERWASLATGARGVICGSAIVDRLSRSGSAREFVGLLKSATFNDKAGTTRGRND